MRLVWVPQWTVLPVIVEDQDMSAENIDRSRVLSSDPEIQGTAEPAPAPAYNHTTSSRKLFPLGIAGLHSAAGR